MWTYKTNVKWKHEDHADLQSEEKPTLQFTPPVEFGGQRGLWTPEDLLVGAVESCLHLTVMHFVGQMKIGLDAYKSEASGQLEKTPEGLRFSEIRIRIDAEVAQEGDVEKMRKAVEQGEKFCPVGAALHVPVRVELSAHTSKDKAA